MAAHGTRFANVGGTVRLTGKRISVNYRLTEEDSGLVRVWWTDREQEQVAFCFGSTDALIAIIGHCDGLGIDVDAVALA